MRALAFTILSLATISALGAEVYKSVDDNGVVKFSDRPDAAQTSERVVVVTADPVARPRPAPSSRQSEQPEQPPIAGGETAREPTAAERAEDSARNCELATERAERYRTSHRLYRELPNGEREYLDDAQLAQARASAEADVAKWCN